MGRAPTQDFRPDGWELEVGYGCEYKPGGEHELLLFQIDPASNMDVEPGAALVSASAREVWVMRHVSRA